MAPEVNADDSRAICELCGRECSAGDARRNADSLLICLDCQADDEQGDLSDDEDDIEGEEVV